MDHMATDKADEYLDQGLPIIQELVQKDSSTALLKLWLRGHYYKAINYSYKGVVEEEIRWTDKVIPIALKLKDYDFLTNVYTNMGILKMNLGENESAHASFKKSERLNQQLNSPKRSVFTNLMFAQLYYQMDSLEAMNTALDRAIPYLEVAPNALDWLLYYEQKGLYHSKIGAYEQAISYLDKAQAIVDDRGLEQEKMLLLQKYAMVSEAAEKYPEATTYISQYIQAAVASNTPYNKFKGHYRRARYHALQENYKNAYRDLRLSFELYDSLESAQNIMNAKELELKYDTAEKEKEILALTVTNEQKKSQTYLLLGLTAALLFMLSAAYLIYTKRLRKVRKKAYLQKTELEVLKQEQQNKIFSAMIEGQEKERKRLAIDLHDGLGGRLSGISLNLSQLNRDEPRNTQRPNSKK